MHPESSVLSQAFADLVMAKKWKSFALVYEEEEHLIRVKHLLAIPGVKVLIRQVTPSSETYGHLLQQIKVTGETNVVLSVSKEKVTDVLTAARDLLMLTEYNNYIIASLDIHLMNVTQFAPSNISGVTLDSMGPKKYFTVRQALLVDALWLFAGALDQLFSTSSVFPPPKVTCESPQSSWPVGRNLVNLMKVLNVRGITGRLRFNQSGERSDFALDLLELNKLTFLKVCVSSHIAPDVLEPRVDVTDHLPCQLPKTTNTDWFVDSSG